MPGAKMNGYHVHMSEISKGQGLQCAAGAPSWHALSKEEKDRYAVKAAEVRLQAETNPAALKKTLLNLLQKLGHLGIDSAVMLVEKETRRVEVFGHGVVKTILLNNEDVIKRVKNQYGSSHDGTATVAELQEHVRSKMNGVAGKCTLKFKGFPWKAVQDGKIRISGWPAGLKKYVVSSMSRSDLKRILDAEIIIHGFSATTEGEQAPLNGPDATTGSTTVDDQVLLASDFTTGPTTTVGDQVLPAADFTTGSTTTVGDQVLPAADFTTGMEADPDVFMNEFSRIFGAEKEEVMTALITEESDPAAPTGDLNRLIQQVQTPSQETQEKDDVMAAETSEEFDPAALPPKATEKQMVSSVPAPKKVTQERKGKKRRFTSEEDDCFKSAGFHCQVASEKELSDFRDKYPVLLERSVSSLRNRLRTLFVAGVL